MKNLFNSIRIDLSKIALSLTWAYLCLVYFREYLNRLIGVSLKTRGFLYRYLLYGSYALLFYLFWIFLLNSIEFFYKPTDSEKRKLSQLYQIVIVCSVLIVLIESPLKYLHEFLTFPYPIELRETASIYPAVAMANGVNPYAIHGFPEYIYTYGILYPLSLAPFINLSEHPLLVGRAYNLLFFALFSGLSIAILRNRGSSRISSLIGLMILINSMCQIWAWNGVRPDAPALFFSFLSYYILEKGQYSFRSILFGAIACVVGLHFKQYMAFSGVVIAIYLFLFISKRNAIHFIAVFSIFSLISYLVILKFFPLYLEYSVLHHLIAGGYSKSTAHLLAQTKDFIKYFWILLLLFVYHIYKKVTGKKGSQLHLDFKTYSKPLINSFIIDSYTVGVLLSSILLAVWLGKHAGNVYTYFGELLLPLLLYTVIPKIDEWCKNTTYRNFLLVSVLIFCVLPLSRQYSSNFSAWSKSYNKLEQIYNGCSNAYDQTALASLYKIENYIHPVYNNGHVEYAPTVIPDKDSLMGRLFNVPAEEMEAQLEAWNNNIKINIENRKFDCIFSIDETYIQYTKVDTIENATGWVISVLVPRDADY